MEVPPIVAEAMSAGVMEKEESWMIAGVMRVADRTARRPMTPRHVVAVLDIDSDKAEVLRQARDIFRSGLPVREGNVDNNIEVLTTRDMLGPMLLDASWDLRAPLREAPDVRNGQDALEVVNRLRTAQVRMLLVYDDYGHFGGIVLPKNGLVVIAVDFPEHATDEPKVVMRAD